MNYVLDRFEGENAILEDEYGKDLIISINELPKSAKEGDLIKYINDTYLIDIEGTDARKKRINEKMKKLIKK